MNPLLADPIPDQSRLLEVIFDGYTQTRGTAWPIFQYVERCLWDDGLDARSVVLGCPVVHFGGAGGYGWLFSVDRQLNVLQPGDRLGLTVAGLARLSRGQAEVARFLAVLATLVARERAFTPSPTELQTVTVHSGELRDPPGRASLTDCVLARMPGLLAHEPSTWHCQRRGDDGSPVWTLTLDPQLRRFDRIEDADSYVERVFQVLAPPAPPAPALHPSSLSLPEAIDYLNAVWRLGVGDGRPLIAIARAEAAAKLALDCVTADELESRLSALCSMLDHLQIPGTEGKGKLVDLRAYLDSILPVGSADWAREAIDDLRAFADLRAWRQHPGADQRGRAGMQQLSIELPTGDWDGAWRYLQGRAVAALSALREEVQDLGQDGSA